MTTTGRGAVFDSADNRLLWRGEHERRGALLPRRARERTPKVKRHRVNGAVLAGAFLGRRLVLAVADGGRIRIRAIGKRLAGVDAIDVLLSEIDLDQRARGRANGTGADPPALPVRRQRSISAETARTWWTLSPEGAWAGASPHRYRASALDAPRPAYSRRAPLG